MASAATVTTLHHAGSGIRGLDDILRGGFRRRRLYVVEGEAGTGKTTLGLQFLLTGLASGERGLYVSLTDTKEELEQAARSHGWSDVDGLDVCEIGPRDPDSDGSRELSFDAPTSGDLEDAVTAVLGIIDETNPRRVVIDSLSELRMLANDPGEYRRHVHALKRVLVERACTALFLDALPVANDQAIHAMAHGVLTLEQLANGYGRDRRRLRLRKLREPSFSDGYHDYVIRPGGLDVYPRLDGGVEEDVVAIGPLSSGIAELDMLVGGHIERGTSTLVLGASGVGKSTIATQYVHAAAMRGEPSAVFLFRESRAAWLSRAESMGFNLAPKVADGSIVVQHLNTTSMSPGELVCRVADVAREGQRSLVVLDGLKSLEMGMPNEQYLSLHLNELLEHLGQKGVNTILTHDQHALVDPGASAALWFIADNVLVLRYLDTIAEIRRGISMMKKRIGPHEPTAREFAIRSGRGLWVGEPIRAKP